MGDGTFGIVTNISWEISILTLCYPFSEDF
jgi:hypothetical protein